MKLTLCLLLAILSLSLLRQGPDTEGELRATLKATRTQLLVAQAMYGECYGRIEAVKRRDAANERAIKSGRYLPLPLPEGRK